MNVDDLPEGYRWATAVECDEYSVDPETHPKMIVVPRTVDTTGRPYTDGEADLALPKTMPIEHALNYAIFCLNTFLHPDASAAEDVEDLDAHAEEAIDVLVHLREINREMKNS